MGVFYASPLCWSRWQQRSSAVCLQVRVCPYADKQQYVYLTWDHSHVCTHEQSL